MYLEPHRFTTRASEAAREKPGKALVLDYINLTVKDVVPKDKCQISNELQLHQAFTSLHVILCKFALTGRWNVGTGTSSIRCNLLLRLAWLQTSQHGANPAH